MMQNPRPTKEEVRDVMAEVDALRDGAHWMLVDERLDLEYGDVFDYIVDDPEFFGVEWETRLRSELS
ncbi:hypothetical protein B0E45_31870 [Sinorhizobium sp. A49]|uniref:hypothetical protein n=1 Tax=Sinorhizobium sp. A49 TaxID=1945861 RepID=UPI00098572D8|nr:hypothetical protein [Sinorhizobium sp. A49]OOG62006.1 hypothetical protein B0E45_31870 [Sinorhizobium sp. A49]